MAISTVLPHDLSTHQDFLPLNGADYVEFYVGNARQSAYFYRLAMGMSWIAYAGPETGQSDRSSLVLQQGSIRFVFTSPLKPGNEMAEHIRLHGDGVRDIALCVDDARSAWRQATSRGARSVREPFAIEDGNGLVRMASIAAYGDTVHTFVERHNYRGVFLPGYRAIADDPLARSTGLIHVDHVTGNVGWNEVNRWADFYTGVMGFTRHFPSEHSALLSKTTANGRGWVKLPIHEPPEGRGERWIGNSGTGNPETDKPGIEEYLKSHHGPGVQHIALATDDILYTASRMQEQGVEFLSAPHSRYVGLEKRVGRIDEPVAELKRLGILAGRDEEGSLLRIFTRPVEDRLTLSFEIIQRKTR